MKVDVKILLLFFASKSNKAIKFNQQFVFHGLALIDFQFRLSAIHSSGKLIISDKINSATLSTLHRASVN